MVWGTSRYIPNGYPVNISSFGIPFGPISVLQSQQSLKSSSTIPYPFYCAAISSFELCGIVVLWPDRITRLDLMEFPSGALRNNYCTGIDHLPQDLSTSNECRLWMSSSWKNGIRDACSTADYCPLLSIVIHCCPLLSIVVHCCPLLYIYATFAIKMP